MTILKFLPLLFYSEKLKNLSTVFISSLKTLSMNPLHLPINHLTEQKRNAVSDIEQKLEEAQELVSTSYSSVLHI